ncbi:MAG: RNA polymerase sigma factor [Ruminococcus sp.]|nr:RNA polymerase sigma factor [Ruminococcus sp.]
MERAKLIRAVRAAQQGDREAVELLYNEWSGRLTAFICRQTGTDRAAEDILSETFVAVMEHIGELKTPEAFGGWLYSVAYSKCADFLRSEGREEQFGSDEEQEAVLERSLNEPLTLPEDYAVNESVRSGIREIVGGLKADQRSAVLMYYYEQKSVAEISKATGKKEPAVRKTLQRARDKIKESIERLCAGGALFAAAPLEALLGIAYDDTAAEAALPAGGARLAGGLAVKIAAGAAVAAIAVGVPIGISKINDNNGLGNYVPKDSVSVPTYDDKYFPVFEIKEQIGNIAFACEPEPYDAEELYILTPKKGTKEQSPDTKARLHNVLYDLFGVNADKEKMLSTTEQYYDAIPGRDPESWYETVRVDSSDYSWGGEIEENSSNFFVSSTWKNDGGYLLMYDSREVYLPDLYPETIYDMYDDTKFTIEQALKQAEKTIDILKKNNMFDEGEEPQLSRIGVQHIEGRTVFDLHYVQKRFGLTVNDNGFLPYEGTLGVCSPEFDIFFMGNGHPCYIRNCYSFSVDKKEKVDIAIDYEQAQKILAEGLAENLKFTVTEAALRYFGVRPSYGKPLGELHPTWCFTLEDNNIGHSDTHEEFHFKYFPRYTAHVDALTGELYLVNAETEKAYKKDSEDS